MQRLTMIACFALAALACTARPHTWTHRSYELGKELEAPLGAPFVRFTVMNFVTRGGYAENQTSFSRELLYVGRTGDTLRVTYREFAGGSGAELVRPAFSQELQYDLAQSDVIVFREFRINVLEATNESIRAIVYTDPGSPPPQPGAP